MYASTALWLLLLLGAANAMPALQQAPRAPAPDATDPWVTVDDNGHARTVTPVQTTIDGTPTVLSAAPNAVTATVFTNTVQGEVRTTTATVPNPTPTAAGGAGAFPVCHNKDGDNAPFCLPVAGAELNPGNTYYITWDPTSFTASNTSIRITGSYFNSTTGQATTQAFSSGSIAAAWSFYAWTVDSSLLSGSPAGVNISLSMASLMPGAASMKPFQGPVVLVAKPKGYVPQKAKPPTGPALYIGLPVVLGFVMIMACGTCWWNRKHRHIGLGNVMGRGSKGYGAGKSRRQRMFGGRSRSERKEQGIRLMERDVTGADDGSTGLYRDEVLPDRRPPRIDVTKSERDEFDFAGVPRRDSDALGSLAGSPTEDRFPAGRREGQGNAFRDELSRQERERF